MYNKEEIKHIVGQFLTECNLSHTQVTIGDESAMVMHCLLDGAARINLAVSPSAFPIGCAAEWVDTVVEPFTERTQYKISIMPMQRRIGNTELDKDGFAVQTKASLYRRYAMLNEREPFNPHYIEMMQAFRVKPTIRIGDVVTAIQDYLDIIERLVSQFTVDQHIHTDGDYTLEWDRINGTVHISIRDIRVITLSTATGLFTCMLDTPQLKELNQWLLAFVDGSVTN